MRDAGEPGRGHRPDVQGLRALAVTAVLVFHLWPGSLPGGYVGVDIFFVISGFLITGQLLTEYQSTDRILLLSFYARRIRRLLPAAFTVLAAALVLLVVLVPRVMWRENLTQMRAAAAYMVNWQLAWERTDYLGSDAAPTLVQHYWSLAVEEQLYLGWPVLLLVAFAFGRRLHVPVRITLATVLVVTVGTSFVYAVQRTAADSAFGFFATQSRVWEFAVGGLVAVAPAISWRSVLRVAAGWTGLSLILASCVLLSQDTSFPGWATLLPTLGCALVILGGSARASAPREPSGWPAATFSALVTWLGDHSYSIYLWHWPLIMALPWALHASLGNEAKLGIVAGTLVLAFLTKRYVEDPVRSGAVWTIRRWAWIRLAAAGAAVMVLATTTVGTDLVRVTDHQSDLALAGLRSGAPCFGAAAIMTKSCAEQFTKPSLDAVAFGSQDYPAIMETCQVDYDAPADVKWCTFGDPRPSSPTIVLVGNSYATELVPMMTEWTKGKHVRILLAARSDCLGLTTFTPVAHPVNGQCASWSGQVQSRLLAMDNLSLVVFVTHEDSASFLTGEVAPSRAASDAAENQALSSLRRLRTAGVATVVVKHPPGPYASSVPECIARWVGETDPCARPRADVTGMDALAQLARQHPELTRFLSLDRYLCTATRCHTVVGGVVAYSDERHLTKTYTRSLAPYLGPRIRKAMQLRPSPHQRGW